MKTIFKATSRTNRGYALLVTMVFMGIMLVLFGMMMTYTMTNAKITKRNNQYNSSQAAAEAAAEKVLAQMTHDFEFQSLSNNGSYYASSFVPSSSDMSAWPVKYNYSSPTNSTTNQINVYMGPWSSNSVPLNSQYAGLQGWEQDCVITATATPQTGVAVPATVMESLQFAEIPLFQFAIFYNMNLEIAAAATLNIKGAVYSNGGIWSGSTSITFASTVSAVGLATNSVNNPFCANYTGSGLSTYSVAGQPTSGNDTLTMPVGNNNPASVEAIVNLPPSTYALGTAAAFTTNGQIYFANKADLYLTNTPTGTNWNGVPTGTNLFLYYQDGNNGTNYQMWVTNDYYAMKTGIPWTNHVQTSTAALLDCVTNVKYAGYSFLTNVLFFDAREGWHGGSGPPKAVQSVQLDLVNFNNWLANPNINGGSNYNYNLCNLSNHKNRSIDSIYVYNAVPLTSTVLPAVRIMHGAKMPPVSGNKGFTLATAQPLYIYGDYNVSNTLGSSLDSASTTYTEPAGLMADSITILSSSWSDSGSASINNSGGPNASTATEINAACLEGIVQSTNNPASNAHGYSGGVENFLRLLENWSGSTLWYNGSIVVMFPSIYATNCWQQTGNYYTAPTRKWAFDTNFNNYIKLPPMTPTSQGVIRATWVAN